MSKDDNGHIVSFTLNGAEALFGFGGWLTSRAKKSGPFSGSDNSSEMAELIAEFIKVNDLGPVRDNWHKQLKHPD